MEERISTLTIRFDEYLTEQQVKQQVSILRVLVSLWNLSFHHNTFST